MSTAPLLKLRVREPVYYAGESAPAGLRPANARPDTRYVWIAFEPGSPPIGIHA